MEVTLSVAIDATVIPEDALELARHLERLGGSIIATGYTSPRPLNIKYDKHLNKLFRNKDYGLFQDVFGNFNVCHNIVEYYDHLLDNLPRVVSGLDVSLSIPRDKVALFLLYIEGDSAFTAVYNTINDFLN